MWFDLVIASMIALPLLIVSVIIAIIENKKYKEISEQLGKS